MEDPTISGSAGHPIDLPISIVPGGVNTPVPPPPASLKPRGAEAWWRYWTTGRRWLSNEAHFDLIVMICEALDDREELRDKLRRERSMVVRGSMGQKVAHPLIREIGVLDSRIADLLNRAGFEPPKQRKIIGQKRQSKIDEMRERKAQAGD